MEVEKNAAIKSHIDLRYRIMFLKNKKAEQEEKILREAKELYYSVQPASMFQKAYHAIADDREVQGDIKTLGVKTIVEFLINKFLNKNNNLKGFITSAIVQRMASKLIDNNSDSIMSGINKFVSALKSSPAATESKVDVS